MNWRQIDLWIVIGYLLVMFGIAFWYRRFARASLENYFLGGRKIPGWLNGISYTAALVSPDAATAYGGLAMVTGGFICWWYLSRFGLALFLGGVLFAVFWRRLNLFTTLEFYELRFEPRAANAMRLWIAVRTAFIALPAWTGITLLASCKIMEPALGLSKMQTLSLVVPISFLYVFLAGYRGVVISNFIQMVIFFAGTSLLAGLTLTHFGGPTALAVQLGAANPEILKIFPPMENGVLPMAAALAWLLGQSIGYGGDAAPMGGAMEGQRILSTRTPGEALTMYVVTAFTMFTLLLLVTLPCLAGGLLWPDLLAIDSDRELVYGRLMKMMLPAGVMGLMIAAMLAAAMSTVADNLNFGSQILTSDIYRRWFVSTSTEKHYLFISRLGMLLILGLSIAVVFNVRIIIDVAIFMLQLSAAELPANWAQWWWWRFNGKARIAASFGGALIFCTVVLGPKLLLFLGVSWAEKLILPWWWQTLLVMSLNTVSWVTVALVTKPDPEPLLRKFYRRAHPLGCWTPFTDAGELSNRESNFKPVWRGILVALCGAVATSLFIVGLTQAWLGRFAVSGASLVASIVLLAVFSRTAKTYLDFLALRAEANECIAPLAGQSQPYKSNEEKN